MTIPIIGPIAPIAPFTPTIPPIATSAPFTYQSASSYQEQIEELRKYVNNTVQGGVNTALNELIDTVNSSLVGQSENVDATVLALTSAVNAAVEMVITNAIEVSDPVIAAVLEDEESASVAALDAAYSRARTFDLITNGAIGDGVTDNTAVITDTLTRALNFGVKVIDLPAGDFKVNTTRIEWPRSIRGRGQGTNTSIIRGPGGDAAIYVKGGSQGVGADWGGGQFTGITFHGMGVVFGETLTDWGNGASVDDVEFRYSNVGLRLRYNTWVFRASNFRIHQCGVAGILHDFTPVEKGSGANISYINGVVFNCPNSGFKHEGVAIDGGHISFVNTDIENCGISYNIENAGQTVFELTNGHYELNNVAFIRADSGLIWIDGCWMFELRPASVTKIALFDLSGTARVMVEKGRISWSAASPLLRNTSSSTRALVIDPENVILPQVGMDATVPGNPVTADSNNGLVLKPGSSRSTDVQVTVPTAGVPVRVMSTHPYDRTTYECEWTTVLSGVTTGVNMLVHVRSATGGATFTVPMEVGATLVNAKLKMSLTEAVLVLLFNNGQRYVGRQPLTHTPATTRYIEMALGNTVTGVIVSRDVLSRGV